MRKSSYVKFAISISGKKYSLKKIEKDFAKLVDKEDYQKSNKDAIIKHLYKMSNN